MFIFQRNYYYIKESGLLSTVFKLILICWISLHILRLSQTCSFYMPIGGQTLTLLISLSNLFAHILSDILPDFCVQLLHLNAMELLLQNIMTKYEINNINFIVRLWHNLFFEVRTKHKHIFYFKYTVAAPLVNAVN